MTDTENPLNPFDEPVVLPIDLHAFQAENTASLLQDYIEQCRQAGILELRVIHGKGAGVQRRIVRSLLQKHPSVIGFQDAPAQAGGWGEPSSG